MSSAKVWNCADGADGADGADRDKAVSAAVAAMRRGGLVILPTENSYVVATDAFSLRGTALLRRAKMQPVSTPWVCWWLPPPPSRGSPPVFPG